MNKKEFHRVGLDWHGWLFRETHFIGSLWLEANVAIKLPVLQTLDNIINFLKINPNIILFIMLFSLNIYEYPKYR